jgi:UDP-N-acetylglucosamine acyltransferase
MSSIHPTAIIADGATIGQNVTIDPYAVIDADVIIGDDCHIHTSVRLYNGARLGRCVQVFPSATIAAVPQDLKFGGEYSTVSVGDHTMIREFVTLHRGTGEGGKTTVGKNCLIMAYSHVAHDCVVGDHVILANSVQLAGHVTIEDWAILGGILPVHQFVRIGRHAMVGGGFRVPKDIPPYVLSGGYPMRYHGINAIGLRRRGFSSEDLNLIRQAYKHIFRSTMNVSQATEYVAKHMGDSEVVRTILEFIRASERGIMPGRRTETPEILDA